MASFLANLLPTAKAAMFFAGLGITKEEEGALDALIGAIRKLPLLRQIPEEMMPTSARALVALAIPTVDKVAGAVPPVVGQILGHPLARRFLAAELEPIVAALSERDHVAPALTKLMMATGHPQPAQHPDFSSFLSEEVFPWVTGAIAPAPSPSVLKCGQCGFVQIHSHGSATYCRACGHVPE